MINKNLTILTL